VGLIRWGGVFAFNGVIGFVIIEVLLGLRRQAELIRHNIYKGDISGLCSKIEDKAAKYNVGGICAERKITTKSGPNPKSKHYANLR
jgi:hypothetical protein